MAFEKMEYRQRILEVFERKEKTLENMRYGSKIIVDTLKDCPTEWKQGATYKMFLVRKMISWIEISELDLEALLTIGTACRVENEKTVLDVLARMIKRYVPDAIRIEHIAEAIKTTMEKQK